MPRYKNPATHAKTGSRVYKIAARGADIRRCPIACSPAASAVAPNPRYTNVTHGRCPSAPIVTPANDPGVAINHSSENSVTPHTFIAATACIGARRQWYPNRSMKNAHAIAVAKAHASPRFGEAPSNDNNPVPSSANNAPTQITGDTRRRRNTALIGNRITYKLDRNAIRGTEVYSNPIACVAYPAHIKNPNSTPTRQYRHARRANGRYTRLANANRPTVNPAGLRYFRDPVVSTAWIKTNVEPQNAVATSNAESAASGPGTDAAGAEAVG